MNTLILNRASKNYSGSQLKQVLPIADNVNSKLGVINENILPKSLHPVNKELKQFYLPEMDFKNIAVKAVAPKRLEQIYKIDYLEDFSEESLENLQSYVVKTLQNFLGNNSEDLSELADLGAIAKQDLIAYSKTSGDFDYITISFISIFVCLAKSLANQVSFRESMQLIISNLNSTMAELTTEIQEALKTAQEEIKNKILEDIKTSSLTGIFLSIATTIISTAMIIGGAMSSNPALIVAGSILLANSIAQLTANASLYDNPEHALQKDGSWENALAQSGIFGLVSLCGWKDGGPILDTLVAIAMIIATEGSSILSTASSSVSLTAGEIAARMVAALNSFAQIGGMIGSLFSNSEYLTELSLGLGGLVVSEIFKATHTEKELLSMILKILLITTVQFGSSLLHSVGGVDTSKVNAGGKVQELVKFGSVFTQGNFIKGAIYSVDRLGITMAKNDQAEHSAETNLKKSLNDSWLKTFDAMIKDNQSLVEEMIKFERKLIEDINAQQRTFTNLFTLKT